MTKHYVCVSNLNFWTDILIFMKLHSTGNHPNAIILQASTIIKNLMNVWTCEVEVTQAPHNSWSCMNIVIDLEKMFTVHYSNTSVKYRIFR
jgi:hypothetical protein